MTSKKIWSAQKKIKIKKYTNKKKDAYVTSFLLCKGKIIVYVYYFFLYIM
jgi:hypothetical protein